MITVLARGGEPLAGATQGEGLSERSPGTAVLQRRVRTLAPRLRRALWARDGQCRFPGCENRLTDAHHVHPWSQGGATTLANLVSLCRRHHKAVHEHGFHLTMGQDGAVRVARRDGVELPGEGRRSCERVVENAAPLAFEGLARIHETIPLWDESPVDHGAAVEGLVRRARRTHSVAAVPPSLVKR